MARLRNRILIALLLCAVTPARADVVISQVYGGGGNKDATHRNDFIEIFNRGTSAVNISQWSVQYASADASAWHVTPLNGTLAPGQYFLVREGTGSSGDGALLPAPDALDEHPMAADRGKVALVQSETALTGACPAAVLDLVVYGNTTCAVLPAPELDNQTSARRRDGGCMNTGNNSADFEAVTPTPRNRVSPASPCGAVDEPPAITGPADPIATVTQDHAPFDLQLGGSDDHGVFVWSASEGPGVADVSVTGGQGSATVTYTVALQPGFNGMAAFTAQLSDGVNAPDSQLVNIRVTAAGPPPLDHVVISQIYSSGGNPDAMFRNDYVELYNPTAAGVDLTGWTLQYAAASGTSWRTQALAGTIGSGDYYLVALASGGSSGTVLPPANVEGGFNMSATAGKVALVDGDDDRDGCPVGEPGVVDLVGYGNSATCFEGPSKAPAGSDTTAIFRKNDGQTDTNVNGADFETRIANPYRRTAPILERGPTIRRVDPWSGTSVAPRDASVTITFSEAVEITSSVWFDLGCAATGPHPDATIGHSDDSRTWVITPNVNFQPGEECTVTVFGNLVRDVDLDDSATTDTLPGDYSWKFRIATGAEPPYPPEVHLAMGNPSGATEDVLDANDYLMQKPEYALSYNRDRRIANWASWHLDELWTGNLERNDTFRADPAVPPDWFRVLPIHYAASGFDRGHLVPNADRNETTSVPINQATYLMTNIVPQAPDNNQGPWVDLEKDLRALLSQNELYIVAGGVGTGGIGDNGPATSLPNESATVPARMWKVVLVLPKGDDDVERVDGATRTIAVDMPNVQGIRPDDWTEYLVTVDHVEALTGYDFFANVRDSAESAIEAGRNGANPPGVSDQSLSTDEDVPLAFTLDAAISGSPSYTFGGPAHGSLSGSGVHRTYTPARDFNGADGFTFRISNANGGSGVATATIAVRAVNDPPVLADDERNMSRNATLELAAAELLANDRPGPADEGAQTLTITGVAGATHGTVTLRDGTVTYVPSANYSGPASFSYMACDDAGPPLCDTATVRVTVIHRAKRRAVRR